jgi:TIR domain-containing protein
MSWRIFFSYSHKDAELRQMLATFLAPLKRRGKIEEWYDRQIRPGADWNKEISSELDSANLILFLVSADFLASDYCDGVEVEKAMTRLKRKEVEVVPILLRQCLWKESRFSELQFIPRNDRPIIGSPSLDEAFAEVAREIQQIVAIAPPLASGVSQPTAKRFDSSLDLVRDQIRSYSRQYERTRQRMRPSDARTQRMEEVFERMRQLAPCAYPLMDELAESPSPGERLCSVAILQLFAAKEYLPFLVEMVGSEKPFVGYHAIKALRFAVGALDPLYHQELSAALDKADVALRSAVVGLDEERQQLLQEAKDELSRTTKELSAGGARYD